MCGGKGKETERERGGTDTTFRRLPTDFYQLVHKVCACVRMCVCALIGTVVTYCATPLERHALDDSDSKLMSSNTQHNC